MKRDQGLLFSDMYLCVTPLCLHSTKVIYMSFTCYLINPDIECSYFSIKGKIKIPSFRLANFCLCYTNTLSNYRAISVAD